MMAAAESVVPGFGASPRVNLMPRAEIDRRERVSLVRRWVWALLAAVAAVAVLASGGAWLQWSAQQRLEGANAETTALIGELADLADIRQISLLEAELAAFRAQAMATEVAWPGVVGRVRDAMPEDVVISGFDLTPGAIAEGEDPALEVGTIGTFSFESPTPVEIVALIRSVRALPGMLDADGWELTSQDGEPRVYTYVLRTTFDQSVYSGDFVEEEAQ
jgi:hypothetical protein